MHRDDCHLDLGFRFQASVGCRWNYEDLKALQVEDGLNCSELGLFLGVSCVDYGHTSHS